MIYYWLVSFFVFFVGVFGLAFNKEKRSKPIMIYLYVVCVMLLIIFGGVRSPGTGIDDMQYVDFFYDINAKLRTGDFFSTVKLYRYEPVMFLLFEVSSFISSNAGSLIFLFCALSVSINSFFIKKLSPYPILSLSVYSAHNFINKDLNQIRFGLASALFLGFVYFLVKRKFVAGLVFFLLSFFSQATAIVSVIPVVALRFLKSKYAPMVIILLSIPLSYIGSVFLIKIIAPYMGGVGERGLGYIKDEVVSQSPFSLGNLKNILLVFLFSIFLLNEKISNRSIEEYNKYYKLVLIFSIGGAVRIFFSDYASGSRLANYLLQVEPVILVFLCFEMKGWKRFLSLVLLFSIVSYYLYYNTIQNAQSVTGYGVADFFDVL